MIRIDPGDEAALTRGARGVFTDGEIVGLRPPVRRFFAAAVAAGTPLAQTVRIDMKGQIKVGRWLPFRATEVLSPHAGFVWAARAAGIISGADRFVSGRGAMLWKLAGLIPVVRTDGPDVSHSAAQRAAAEAIWVPTALLPRFGVEWSVRDDLHITARYRLGDHPIEIDCTLTPGGLVASIVFARWGDPEGTGDFGPHPFGGEFTAHAAFGGLTIPSEGHLGWHYGTAAWGRGEFFRYRITDLELLGVGAEPT